MSVKTIADVKEFENCVTSAKDVVVVHFWAPWSEGSLQMDEVFAELSQSEEFHSVVFVKVEAEALPEISAKYNIIAVPTFTFLKSGQTFDRLDGVYPVELKKKLMQCVSNGINYASPTEQHAQQSNSHSQDLNTRLKNLINSNPCIVFMKGNATEPRCGFSKQLVALLNQANADYKTFDILSDEEVRTGLKEYSNWPTYPQLYINGELIGGLDIIKELLENNELQDKLPKAKQPINDRLKSLINKSSVMVFLKGDRNEPKCGFSKSLVQILNDTNVSYETFDILQDEDVRQGLKAYSNWPTYPQVYVKGELIGGLDIIKEMQAAGDLQPIFSA